MRLDTGRHVAHVHVSARLLFHNPAASGACSRFSVRACRSPGDPCALPARAIERRCEQRLLGMSVTSNASRREAARYGALSSSRTCTWGRSTSDDPRAPRSRLRVRDRPPETGCPSSHPPFAFSTASTCREPTGCYTYSPHSLPSPVHRSSPSGVVVFAYLVAVNATDRDSSFSHVRSVDTLHRCLYQVQTTTILRESACCEGRVAGVPHGSISTHD